MACLIDPMQKTVSIKQNLLEEAVSFVSILPKFFSDDFDRITLWDRIGNGLLAASQKADGDCELFINSVLAYIKASPSSVAASNDLSNMLSMFTTRDNGWKEAFIKQFQEYHYLIIVKARNSWNSRKKQKENLDAIEL